MNSPLRFGSSCRSLELLRYSFSKPVRPAACLHPFKCESLIANSQCPRVGVLLRALPKGLGPALEWRVQWLLGMTLPLVDS